jgi:hypothetical protein
MPGYRAVHLDELEAVPWAGDMTWHPVRGQLGIRAFGAAAFTAAETGEPVVEPHSESEDGRGHEELYYVARGHAAFTIEGEEIDAPEGTLVYVPDPAAMRSAVAQVAGTTVVGLGGTPGEAFSVSAWERKYDPAAAR